MKNSEQILMIPKIELGIVIDHIPAGQGIKILKILSKAEEMKDIAFSLGINYISKKLERKDLIKIQTEYLSPEIIQQISILVPGVTVKAIKEFKVHSKVVVKAPKEIRNLLNVKIPIASPIASAMWTPISRLCRKIVNRYVANIVSGCLSCRS